MKKVLKIIGIIFLVLIIILGILAIKEHESNNKSIKKIRIWYPKELENSDIEYPMIVVVNASGVPAFRYEPFFKRLASWGFIVVGNEDGQSGKGETTSITLDYMLNIPNDSKLYNKIDKENIGIFTGSAAYPFLANNMGWSYDTSKIKIPYFMTAGTGKSDDAGNDSSKEFGGVAPLSSLIENYNKISDDVFKVRARSVGTEHENMLEKTDPYMTAWMLYQLKGDEEASKVFIGEDAELLNNKNWQDIEKNK